jgi:hypothetical protein
MGMMPAMYSTTSTKKPKQMKFKSAEAKRKYYEQQEAWENLKRKYDVKPKSETVEPTIYRPERVAAPRGDSKHYPSRDTGGGSATKPVLSTKVYTGTKMLGIATLHKSNAVPVFSDQEAKDISTMRRG